MTKSEQLANELRGFTGTEKWYRATLNPYMTYTDGVRHFAEKAGAYWFLDIVATELAPRLRQEEFQAITLITLAVTGNEAEITAGDGNGCIFWRRKVDYTDCPEGAWEFYLFDDVLLLPSEY